MTYDPDAKVASLAAHAIARGPVVFKVCPSPKKGACARKYHLASTPYLLMKTAPLEVDPTWASLR